MSRASAGGQTRRDRERAARRQAIVEAATRLFSRRGPEAVSMDEVAREAQFTKRTVYQYFDSKESLLLAAAADLLQSYEGEFAPRPGEARSGLRGLELFGRRFIEVAGRHPGAAVVMSRALSLRRLDPRGPDRDLLEGRLRALYDRYVALVRQGMGDGTIRRDVEPAGAAFAFFFLVVGFLNLQSEGGAAAGRPPELLGRVLYTFSLIIAGLRPVPRAPRERRRPG